MDRMRGFTLLEMMVVITIAAILAAIGVPAMVDFVRNGRLTSGINDFVTATTVARSEATKRQVTVTMCASAAPTAASPSCATGEDATWATGWIVFVDPDGDATLDTGEVLLQRQGPIHTAVTIKADDEVAEYVSFGRDGRTRTTAGAPAAGSLVFCDARGLDAVGDLSTARALSISRTGRPQSLRHAAAINGLDIDCP